ncbi:MerR family transcriptional regulator [Pseudogracilibacillus auburnensis]|uniref:MerR family transcriptional regulator n=1 Tax=Pseudogracilibacillus auburnensis TaxID=1494959 RepID=UPI001A970B39|nr:MerR family transcriptional regulator [Pseudogracilibacillus auburnensis]MBO1002804.1 MerR family transcriptional regulator [Pseudogracilibacillus auburnensis]
MISIKEVTKQTGISVRTLRYYDEINLLPPAGKTEGGHRLYGEKELKKLQEIQFLKTLGFNLKEIKEMLSDVNWNWVQGLENQLNYTLKEKEKILEIESTLKGLINGLTIDGTIDLIYIQKLIQLYQQDSEKRNVYRKRYFHSDERELLERLPNMNQDDPDSLEWVALLGQLKQHMDKGVAAPEIQRIIRRMHEKTLETFGDNDAFFDKIWAIRKSPEKSQEVGFYPIEQEVLDFFEKAWDVFQKNENNV